MRVSLVFILIYGITVKTNNINTSLLGLDVLFITLKVAYSYESGLFF